MVIFIILLCPCKPGQKSEQATADWLEVKTDTALFTAFAWINQGKFKPTDTLTMVRINREVFQLVRGRLNEGQRDLIRSQYDSLEVV